MHIAWNDIEASLETIEKAGGGFSMAHRGIITLPSGKRVFVKIGTDDLTKEWAKKEIETYRFLQRNNYLFMPELVSFSDDEASFALEPLANGWDWSDTWTEARVDKTLEAMDALAAIVPVGADKEFFAAKTFGQDDNGWLPLKESSEMQQALLAKLRAAKRADIADSLNFAAETDRSMRFVFQSDALTHDDVRADNCAWDGKTVKIVDWNWTQLGDRRVDLAGMLVSVQKSGLNLLPHYRDRLDADALHWLAGFWFKAAITPIWPGGPAHLRDFQLLSGIVALDLSLKI